MGIEFLRGEIRSEADGFDFVWSLKKVDFMSRPPHTHGSVDEPASLELKEGWHCLHMYYQVDPAAKANCSAEQLRTGVAQLMDLLNPERPDAPERLQTAVISGHKADLGLILMDRDPLKIDKIYQDVRNSALGTVLRPTYSFVSITEISEYVPSVEQFSEKLLREGANAEDPMFQARVKG